MIKDPLEDFNTIAIIHGVVRTLEVSVEFFKLGKTYLASLLYHL
jgi:hypothetical protein